MKDTTKIFFLELADLLEKHNVTIEASERFIPYCEPGHQVEFWSPGGCFEMDHHDVDPETLRKLVDNS
jgi:hypothetical protein